MVMLAAGLKPDALPLLVSWTFDRKRHVPSTELRNETVGEVVVRHGRKVPPGDLRSMT